MRTILCSLILCLASAVPADARGYAGRPDKYPDLKAAIRDERMRRSPWWQAQLAAGWLGLSDEEFWLLYDVLSSPRGLESVFDVE